MIELDVEGLNKNNLKELRQRYLEEEMRTGEHLCNHAQMKCVDDDHRVLDPDIVRRCRLASMLGIEYCCACGVYYIPFLLLFLFLLCAC